jgi:hypothetical protein
MREYSCMFWNIPEYANSNLKQQYDYSDVKKSCA